MPQVKLNSSPMDGPAAESGSGPFQFQRTVIETGISARFQFDRLLESARKVTMLTIRPANLGDADPIWSILEPVLRAGETYTLPQDISREEALAYWFAPGHQVFVAEDGELVGTYFLRANQRGGGSHVANCGYVTAIYATGRGIARAMCLHSKEQAKREGFRAMQFNFVVSTNERAVTLWLSLGFEVLGTLPKVFAHPQRGLVDALVMFCEL
jgi:ribosomal protein S18 acetylase RimI-like enzyme